MFDIGWGELVLIGIVALIVIGPKELPTVLRSAGHWMGKVRRMASEFQGQFQEAMREAEIADLKKQFDDASNAATSMTSGLTNFDPVETARKEIQSAVETPATTDSTTPVDAPSSADAQPPAETPPATASLDLPPAPEPPPLDRELQPAVTAAADTAAASAPDPDAPKPKEAGA